MTTKPWFINFKRLARPEMRLFCFPYAGGSAALFHAFADNLPRGIELWAANLPGHGSRLNETPMTDLMASADRLAAALVSLTGRIPFALWGHSMGARLAFEIVRLLRLRDWPMPQQLIVTAGPAPQLPQRKRGWHTLPDEKLVAELRKYNGLPLELLDEPQVLALFLPALRADLRMLETAVYEEDRPLTIPITVLGGNQDPLVNVKELEAWREQTNGRFRLTLLDGDHFFLHAAQAYILDGILNTKPGNK